MLTFVTLDRSHGTCTVDVIKIFRLDTNILNRLNSGLLTKNY